MPESEQLHMELEVEWILLFGTMVGNFETRGWT
jgi:hypothetical protein